MSIEVWSTSNEFEVPLAKAKKPRLVTLLNGDQISIRFKGVEIEVDAFTITDLVVKALKENVIFDTQLERRIAHALDLKYHGEE